MYENTARESLKFWNQSVCCQTRFPFRETHFRSGSHFTKGKACSFLKIKPPYIFSDKNIKTFSLKLFGALEYIHAECLNLEHLFYHLFEQR